MTRRTDASSGTNDNLTGDSSQVSRLRFTGTLGQGRQISGRRLVLRVSCEFASASVRPVPRRPRSNTVTGLCFHSDPRPATPDASRNRAPSVTFAARRLGPLTSSVAPLHSASRLGGVAWRLGLAARYTNNIPIPRFSTLLEPFPPLFQPSMVSITPLR